MSSNQNLSSDLEQLHLTAEDGGLVANRYNMDNKHRGKFILINNKTFASKTGLRERTGNDVDASNLERVFARLGFIVERHDNKLALEMLRIMERAADEDHSDSDCFAVGVLSHGEEGGLYGTDQTITVEQFIEPIKKCLSLAGKPKLFFFQPDRGSQLDNGVEIYKDCDDTETEIETDAETEIEIAARIPQEADFLFAYATTPGHYSWRNSSKGSWFIQALCQVFGDLAYEDVDLLHVMTRVSKKIAYDFESSASQLHMNRKKQVSCVISQLTKDLYLAPRKSDSEGSTDDGGSRYQINNKHKRKLILINNKKFDPTTGMGERYGSDVDACYLKRLFEKLSFKVERHDNKQAIEMLKIMEAAAVEDHSNSDCFAVAVLTHGEERILYGTDQTITIEQFIEPIKKCLSLAGKPKLFFFQASRGSQLDDGMEICGDGDQEKVREIVALIPQEADFLFAYATTPGHFSFRNTNRGSWFIQALSQVLDDPANKDLELQQLLTRVNRKMAYDFESSTSQKHMDRKKQASSIVSQFTKDFYFTPKIS